MISREALLSQIRPLAEALALDLATLLCDRFEGQLEQALDVARSALASDLAAPAESAATRKAHAARSNMLRKDANAAAAAGLPRKRQPATCRSCGAVGYTSKGCGTTHETLPPPVAVVVQPPTEPAANVSLPPARAAREPAPAPSTISPPALVEVEEEEVGPEPVVELDAQDDDDEDDDEVVAAPSTGKRDRFAEIEALAKARTSAAPLRTRKSA